MSYLYKPENNVILQCHTDNFGNQETVQEADKQRQKRQKDRYGFYKKIFSRNPNSF